MGVFGVDGSTVTNNLFTPAGTNLWDVIPWSSGGFAIVFDDGANIVVRLVNSSLSTIGSTSVARTNVNSLCIFEELAGTSFYIAVTRTAGSSASIYRIGSTPTVLQTIDFAAGTYYYNCCGITSNPNIYVFFESGSSSASATKERGVAQYTTLSNQTGTTTGVTNPSSVPRAGLGSYPFLIGSDVLPFVFFTHQSEDTNNLQNCYFLMQATSSGTPVLPKVCHAQVLYGKANNYISTIFSGQYRLPRVPAFSSGIYQACLFSRLDSTFNLTGATATYGLAACSIQSQTTYAGSKSFSFGLNSFLVNNGVYIYDGNQVTEFGYYLYPDPVQSTTNAGAGNVADGTYQYVVVYEYYDAKGNILESSPSQAYSVTYAAGSARTYTINLNRAGFISKSATRVSLYRTAASGTIFYYVNSTDLFTASSLTVTDNVSNTVLTSRKILYTTGGVAENIIPPNANFVCQAKNRLWTFETGSTDTIWFSKTIRSGFLPAFSDLLTLKVASAGGELVALAQIDDKLIIFKERIVFALLGDGPTENLIGEFSVPLQITSGMGCVAARSVVETPVGIFYESQEGIYLVDRSLQNMFIGRPVYKNEGTIIGSQYDPVYNRVFFLTTTQIWVYYVSTNAWYSWTATNPVDLLLEGGVLYQLTSSKLLKQGTGYQDDGSNYAQTLKLGQFSFAGLQSYQRLYRVLITGRATNDANTSNLTIKNYFNSNTTATDTLTLQHSSAISNNRFEVEVRPSVQKCETMELELSLTANTSGFIVSAASAEVGALPGAGRRAESRRPS